MNRLRTLLVTISMLLAVSSSWAGDAVVQRLVERLQTDKDFMVRKTAAKELGRLGPRAKAAVPALIAAFKDSDPAVREPARDALRKIGEPAIGPLLEAMKDPDETIRSQAIIALGMMGSKAKVALTPIDKAHEDDESPAVRSAAHTARVQITYEAKEVLPMLTNRDEEKRHAGVKRLMYLTPDQARSAISPLCRLFRNEKNPEIHVHIHYVLDKFTRDDELSAPDRNLIISTMTAALKDSNEAVGRRAAVNLESFGAHAQSALPAIQQAYKTAKDKQFKEALERADARIRAEVARQRQ